MSECDLNDVKLVDGLIIFGGYLYVNVQELPEGSEAANMLQVFLDTDKEDLGYPEIASRLVSELSMYLAEKRAPWMHVPIPGQEPQKGIEVNI